MTAPEAAERLGKKLSLVEISLRKLVRRLLESGCLPPELADQFREWQRIDAIRPAREAKRSPKWRAVAERRAEAAGSVEG